jgi:Ca-activated chloride channel family protein
MSSRSGLTVIVSTFAALLASVPTHAQRQATPQAVAQPTEAAVTFRSGVNLVSVAAVVRDKRGRVMSSLNERDFVVLDGGQQRALIDFQSTTTAPASVGLLIDGSGSMRLGAAHEIARRISRDILATLDPSRDTAALLSFDTRLLTLCEFTRDFEAVRAGLRKVESFGSTSLYDAMAGASGLVAENAQSRRAVIVLTDGADTSSQFTPEKVAWIASTIDVPVYVFVVGGGLAPGVIDGEDGRANTLVTLARATGGDLFVANSPDSINAAVKRVTEELRHQYVLAFESASEKGVRKLEVRTRRPELRVKSRNWYQAAE